MTPPPGQQETAEQRRDGAITLILAALGHAEEAGPIFPINPLRGMDRLREQVLKAQQAAVATEYTGGPMQDFFDEIVRTAAVSVRILLKTRTGHARPLDPLTPTDPTS